MSDKNELPGNLDEASVDYALGIFDKVLAELVSRLEERVADLEGRVLELEGRWRAEGKG